MIYPSDIISIEHEPGMFALFCEDGKMYEVDENSRGHHELAILVRGFFGATEGLLFNTSLLMALEVSGSKLTYFAHDGYRAYDLGDACGEVLGRLIKERQLIRIGEGSYVRAFELAGLCLGERRLTWRHGISHEFFVEQEYLDDVVKVVTADPYLWIQSKEGFLLASVCVKDHNAFWIYLDDGTKMAATLFSEEELRKLP